MTCSINQKRSEEVPSRPKFSGYRQKWVKIQLLSNFALCIKEYRDKNNNNNNNNNDDNKPWRVYACRLGSESQKQTNKETNKQQQQNMSRVAPVPPYAIINTLALRNSTTRWGMKGWTGREYALVLCTNARTLARTHARMHTRTHARTHTHRHRGRDRRTETERQKDRDRETDKDREIPR